MSNPILDMFMHDASVAYEKSRHSHRAIPPWQIPNWKDLDQAKKLIVIRNMQRAGLLREWPKELEV